MKLQFPFSIGVFVASFAAVGCGTSNAEIEDRRWQDAGADDAAMPQGGSPAEGGNDAAVYDNDASMPSGGGQGGSAAAGKGGSGAGGKPGSAGKGGSAGGEPVAGSGEEEAGSGGNGAAGEMAEGGSGGDGGPTCPTEYAMATHIVMDVSWKETKKFFVTVVKAGTGKVHLWTKSRFTEDGKIATVVSKSCGSTLPTIEALGEKLLPVIPNSAWEQETMPEFTGTATKDDDNNVFAEPGVALVGLTMSNPTAPWPARSAIMGVDHDNDGRKGLAAIPKTDEDYKRIPVNLNRDKRADRLDLAIRNHMTLSSNVEGCPDTYTGTADVKLFDNHIIGCHVYQGGECTSDEIQFVDDNRTVFTVKSATFTATRVDDDADCDAVRNALP
jgi:hypothetical protein